MSERSEREKREREYREIFLRAGDRMRAAAPPDPLARSNRQATWVLVGLVVLGLWLMSSLGGGCQARSAQCREYGYDSAGEEC